MNSYTADKYDGLLNKRIGSKGFSFRIGRDVRTFIIFIGCLINQPPLILILIAIITNLENIRRMVVFKKIKNKLRGADNEYKLYLNLPTN